MELPRPRPFGTEGKDRTLDFLSLHDHSSFQHQDPRAQRVYLETQDFLRPLEQVEKNINNGKAENKSKTATVEKLPPPSSSSPSSSSAEHILPGGIGTYSISHISNFIQRVPKTEQIPGSAVDRASSVERNCEPNRDANSSIRNNYGGGVFTTLWDEAAVLKKGGSSTVKDTAGERQVLREAAEKAGGQWPSERTLQTPYVHRNSFSSLSTSKQSAAKNNNNKSFLEMMKSGRGVEDDEDEAGEEFTSKKAVSSSHQEGKNVDQKANNTPRSKHSATEQRRRSKINDRFQILRDLIPQNDQKRDKASFLLEVIDYIQFLQEKMHRYESSYQGWNQEPVKLTPWRNGHGPGESMVDHSRAVKSAPSPALMFTGKFDDSNIAASPTTLANTHNSVEPDLSTSATYKPLDHHVGLANKAVPMKPNSFTPVGGSDGLAHPLQRPDAENMASQHQSQLWQSRPCVTEFPVTGDVLNEQEELTVEGGTISISGVYSQGLLNNLTQALQGLGVDLSQASISVQVDLGKRANRRLTSTTSGAKDHEDPCNNNRTMAREDLDQSLKRRKTE